MRSTDICVVGGGMIGLASACLLTREGFQVTVLDEGEAPRWQDSAVPGRVSALNFATRHLLEYIGVWDAIRERRTLAYQRMLVWDSHSDARIHFDAAEESVPALGYIVENDLITGCMHERLRQNYQVSLRHGCRVAELENGSGAGGKGNAHVQLANGEVIQAELVVAADGARSALREMAGIDLVSQDFQQDAIVATLACERSHKRAAFQVFTPEGPIALLPLNGDRCSLVWSRERQQASALMALDAAEFCQRLEKHFGPHVGGLSLQGERLRFPLGSRHAATYHAGRLALVGDAAHTVHPLAGLGANLGMQDAAALAETVAAARDAGKRIGGQGVMRRYERWRRGENGITIQAMKGFKNLFGSTLTPLRLARQEGFRMADSVMPLKHAFAQYALGIRGDLPAACRPPLGD